MTGIKLLQLNGVYVVLYADNTAVLYNKFDIELSSSLDYTPQPTPDYNCVVDTAGQWRAARCADEHLTVCQSDHDIETGQHCHLVRK